MWSCHSATSPANQTCWRGTRKALFTLHHTGYLLPPSYVKSCQYSFVHVVVTVCILFFPIHRRSWCLWTVTLRTAWVRRCFPIIWWKAAALSSPSLLPTTLKGHCPLSLVVCVPLSLLINDLNRCLFLSWMKLYTSWCFDLLLIRYRFYCLIINLTISLTIISIH